MVSCSLLWFFILVAQTVALIESVVPLNNHDKRQATCFRRTCDQTITGRNLRYGRVLEIVQNEEYLAAADLNVLKRRIGALTSATSRGNDSQISSIPSVKYEETKKTFGIGLIGSTKLRPKRQAAGAQSNSTVDLMPVAVIAGGTLLVTISAIATVPPTLPAVPAGLPPRGYPLPGTYGGGLSPNQVTDQQTRDEALSLLPPGTIPVAIFPPYIFPRTYPAVTIVFQETSQREQTGNEIDQLDFAQAVRLYFKCYKTRLQYRLSPRRRSNRDSRLCQVSAVAHLVLVFLILVAII